MVSAEFVIVVVGRKQVMIRYHGHVETEGGKERKEKRY